MLELWRDAKSNVLAPNGGNRIHRVSDPYMGSLTPNRLIYFDQPLLCTFAALIWQAKA